MAKFYADEQFPYLTTNHLRALGHDVLTVQEAGNANQGIPDEAVLEFATQQGRAVLTLNRRDFIRLHNQNGEHAGVVVCTDDQDKIRLAERINLVILTEELLDSKLIRIVKPNGCGSFGVTFFHSHKIAKKPVSKDLC
jgi:predicted nuclease of predicted toxin-antitoxin system